MRSFSTNQLGSSRGRRFHHPFSDSCVRNSTLAYNTDIFLTLKRLSVYANEFLVVVESPDEVVLRSKWQCTLVLLKSSTIRISAVEPTRVQSRRLKVFALAGVTLAEGFRDWETCTMHVLVILAWHSPYN